MKRIILTLCVLTMMAVSVRADSFYKTAHGTFSTRPDETKIINKLTRFGPVGISIDLIQPAFVMRIEGIEKGSPADATGQLKPGLFLLSINDEPLKGIDPRIQLGDIITKAEAADGKIKLMVADKPDGQAREVMVQIPVLGEYSASWPLDCPKSDKIVRQFAEYLKNDGTNKGFADIGMLFLLSTGDDDDLPAVRQWARAHTGESSYSWHIGYGGVALCEYYLRTGDKEVLPTIQKIADNAIQMENFGGWGGRGALAGVDYGGGGGHVNAGGVLVPAFLFLAKECGAMIPERTLQRVARHWVRWSGRGNVAYGNTLPEAGFTDNGRNGKLAFSMAAAAALTPDGEKSIYAKARDTCASFSFYSTGYMLHGHTGGGIGEIHRSAAMGLLQEKMPKQYRSFMDSRRWHYEMSRRWDGSFAILGGEQYDNETWGAGYALTYTVPRKTLRITGEPPTKYSKQYELPARPWGTAEDDDFLSIKPIAFPDGTLPDISAQSVAEDSAFAVHMKMRSGETDADATQRLVRSPSYGLRRDMAYGVYETPGLVVKDGPDAVLVLLESDDARLRRTALEAVLAAPDTMQNEAIRSRVVARINDADESWFVKEAAIRLVGRGPRDWIVEHVDLVLPYLEHEEWWLQAAALEALGPVANDKRCYRKVIPAVGKLAQTNHLYNMLKPLRWGELGKALTTDADPEIQAQALSMLTAAYTDYQPYDHALEFVEDRVNTANRDVFAEAMVKLPGGYGQLYELATKRNPGAALPYRELFLGADPKDLGPQLRAEINKIIREELIPAHIQKNQEALRTLATSGQGREEPMTELVSLYGRAGVNEYDWQDSGPDRNRMTWWYHSFDPPEKWEGESDRLGRYRGVTFPKGMEEWHSLKFDPKQAGWEQGLAPFGAADGKKEIISEKMEQCPHPFCDCHKPINTLWENDVLLIRGQFKFPPLEPGYRYRLLHGTISHPGSGGGYRLYVNGKLFIEEKNGTDRRGGGIPIGRVITKEWWDDFAKGEVTLAAISFKKHHPRTNKYGGNISIFLQRMKVPPLADQPAAPG